MKKLILPVIILFTSTFANASEVELGTKQSIQLAKLMQSFGVHEDLEGGAPTLIAESVSCTLERSLGVSCVWKITKEGSANIIEQELNEKKSAALIEALSSAGVEAELDGRTAAYSVSKIECTRERDLEASCLLIK